MAPPERRTWTCEDCGLAILLLDEKQMDEALAHWKVCPDPGPAVQERRRRNGMDPQVIPLSPSALDTYDLCPRRSWFERQDPNRVRVASGDAADLGTALHTAAETGDDSPPPGLPLAEADDWPWMLRTMRRLLEDDPLPDVERAEFREERFTLSYPVGEGRTVEYQGKIDLERVYADGSVVADDVKSGRVVPETREELEKSVLCRSYLVGLLHRWPFAHRFRFRHAQLRQNRIVATRWYTREQVEVFDQLLAAKSKAYAEEQLWTPRVGRHCLTMCDFAHRCPAGRTHIGEGMEIFVLKAQVKIETEQDARRVALARQIATAQLGVMTESLKVYVREHGDPINGGKGLVVDRESGEWFGYEQKTKQVVASKVKVLRALMAQGLTLEEALERFNFDHRNKDGVPDDLFTEEQHWTSYDFQKGTKP